MPDLNFDFSLLIPSLVVALLAVVVPELCKYVANRFLKRAKPHIAEWLHILLSSFVVPLAMILRIVLIMVAIAFASTVLPIDALREENVLNVLNILSDLLIIFYLGLGSWRAAPVTRLLLHSAENRLDMQTHQTMGRFFENIFHVLVALFTGIAMLDRLGVPVTGLMTGAGVAGLAISLAAQSTLGNLIAGVTLVLEHPFGIGDYVSIGSYEGTVEDVSFRSTRIRTMDNVKVTIENSKICSEYIQNCDRRKSRLYDFNIGLTYDTSHEKIESLRAKLSAMLQANPDVQENGVSVTLDKFNDYSIDLRCRVYITKVVYTEFLKAKSDLNFQVLDLVRSEGCEFAFPTTTLDIPKE